MAIPPDHFERLGLPRRFALDPAELERGYLARSRAVHPDVHQLGSAGERLASVELSAALNEAYAALRDPFRRAEHLLALEGGPVAADHREMSPAFLMEMLETRERIEEVRGDASASQSLAAELDARRAALLGEVAARFAAYETGRDRAELRKVREALNALKYVQGLIRDLGSD